MTKTILLLVAVTLSVGGFAHAEGVRRLNRYAVPTGAVIERRNIVLPAGARAPAGAKHKGTYNGRSYYTLDTPVRNR